MKLYATTTSERASKGQGGNDFLDINITNEHKEIIANIYIKNNKVHFTFPSHYLESKKEHYTYTLNSELLQQIGKSQKGEINV